MLLAGCGGGSRPATGGATQSALKAAVYRYTSTLLGGSPDAAFAMLSKRCQVDIGRQTYVQEAKAGAALYKGLTLTSYSVDQFAPPVARVTYGTQASALDQTNQPWRYENGAWRWDNC